MRGIVAKRLQRLAGERTTARPEENPLTVSLRRIWFKRKTEKSEVDDYRDVAGTVRYKAGTTRRIYQDLKKKYHAGIAL